MGMECRYSKFALALLASSALCSPAFAQIAPGLAPPLAFQSVDGNDVELHSGRVVKALATISIGPGGPGSLSFDWSTDYSLQQPIWGYLHTTFTPQYPGGPNDTHYSVTVGGSSETFTQVSGSNIITNDQGRPSTLGVGGYTAADGTVAIFNSPVLEGYDSNGLAIYDSPIFSLTYPTGEKLNYYWNQTINSATLKAVTSSLGYQLRLTWSGSQVTSAVVFNMNSEACDPTAASCTLTGTWPTLTWDSVNNRVVDNTGKWVGLTSNSTQRIITYPSGRTLTYAGSTQANGSFKVSSFSDGKGTWTYSYPSQFNNATLVYDPEYASHGPSRQVTWSATTGAIGTDTHYDRLMPSRLA
jgi:hypothetical protein